MNEFINFNSEHYVFHVLRGSLAEKDIDKIISTQEASWQKISNFLEISIDRKIIYFLYPTNEVKGQMMGDDGNGNAIPDRFEVHAVYNEDVKCIGPHEDAHLFAMGIGNPSQLLKEGLAEYMAGSWDGESHNFWAAKYLDEKKLPSILEILDDENWYEIDEMIAYPVAGSFVGCLVSKYGKEKFVKLYRSLSRDFDSIKNENIFKDIIGTSVERAQKEWESSI